jgi:ubiquinone biosynthesis protein
MAATDEPSLRRAARIGKVLARHGLQSASTDEDRARGLRESLEELGPTFCKLGQILSTRPDLIGPAMVAELSKLQDDVPALPADEIERVIAAELGEDWRSTFATFDDVPLAAGTIAQVHRATLLDGTRAVVKVQRPDAERLIRADLALLELFVSHAGRRTALTSLVDVTAVFDHLSTSLRRELDFETEAASAARIAEAVAPYPRIAVPAVHGALSTRRVLVMDEVRGDPVTPAPPTPARREAAAQLITCYYRQILGSGVFHADPHPGNIRFDGQRVWLLDFGMVGELSADERDHVLTIVLAFWQGDAGALAETMVLLAGDGGDVDMPALERDVDAVLRDHRGATLSELELGPLLEAMGGIAVRHHVRLPASLVLAGKALAQVQQTAAALDPELDPTAAIGSYVRARLLDALRRRGDPQALLYEVHRLRLRAVRLIEALERLTGARPGPRLQVDVPGMTRLEAEVRRAAYVVAAAVLVAAVLIATAVLLH